MGLACKKAGPLADKEIEFIKMAINGSQMLETAFKTHARKAAEAGASIDEMQHVVIQLLAGYGVEQNDDGREMVGGNGQTTMSPTMLLH